MTTFLNARDYSPLAAGIMADVVGPPGSGKSTFIRSAALAVGGKAVGLIAPSSELASYAGLDVDFVPLDDPNWRPSASQFVTEGAKEAHAALDAVMKRDDVKLLFVDNMTRVSDVFANAILAPERAAYPRQLSDPRSFYASFYYRVLEFMKRLVAVHFVKKVPVIVSWQEDIKEAEGQGQAQMKVVENQQRLVWESAKMPALQGSLRNEVAQFFDAHLYAEAVPANGKEPFRCRLVALPTKYQLAKMRLPITKALQAQGGVLPNDYPTLMKIVEGALSTQEASK